MFRKIKNFFGLRSNIRKMIAQKRSHQDIIGKNMGIELDIDKYTRMLYRECGSDLSNAEASFNAVVYKSEHKMVLHPVCTLSMSVFCCSKLKVVINLSDEPYIKYKLFKKGKDVASGYGVDIEQVIGGIGKVLRDNKCDD